MPKSDARMRPFDKSWQVCQHKTAIPRHGHDPKHRFLGGERVVSNFGPGPGESREKRAFTGVGLAHQPHVGDHLQFQPKAANLASLPRRGLARRAIGGRLEVEIAPPPSPALGRHDRFARHGEILEHEPRLLVDDDRAGRHQQHQILGHATVAIFGAP